MEIKAVVFDWAGTTVDYGCFAPVKGFINSFKSIGIDITTEMARKPMGLAKLDHTKEIAKMLTPPLSEESVLKVYAGFEEILLNEIGSHCDLLDFIPETVAALRMRGIKIGSTTGYTSAMMKTVLRAAKAAGYAPDFCITPDQTARGRPYPYMIWENLKAFGLANPRQAVKVGDTAADIEEGKNAHCWTVGVVMGSSELGLTRAEAAALPREELEKRKAAVRATYKEAGADYSIDAIDALLPVIDDINGRMKESGCAAFMSLCRAAKNNGVQDWSLEEINSEINAARESRGDIQ